ARMVNALYRATTIGTAEYMSPEQWTGEPQIDGRSDVYSLGCVVYEMLAGRPPFTWERGRFGPLQIMHKQCNERPPELRRLRSELSAATESVVERSLAKAPADRFQTAGEFAGALQGACNPRRLRDRLADAIRHNERPHPQ